MGQRGAPPALSMGSVGIMDANLCILELVSPPSVEKATWPQEAHQLIPELELSTPERWSRLFCGPGLLRQHGHACSRNVREDGHK